MKAGWTTATLSEVCEFQRGLTYAKSDEVDTSRNVVLRANNIDLVTNRLDLTDLRFISDAVVIPAIKRVRRDSLLVCTASGSKAHLGKVAFIDTDYDFAFGGFMGQLTPGEQVLPKFLFYIMISEAYKDFIASLSDGANINNLKFTDLGRFRIPLPPLPEQRRIVALLDEAFAGLATAAANAERNLDNARELFESHLAEVFSRRGDGWVETTLSACTGGVFTGPFGSLLHKKDYVENGIPLVNPAHITEEGIEADITKTVSPATASRLASYVMRRDDVVIGRRGEMGRCAVVTEAQDGWLCGTGSFFIRPSSQCDSRFLVRLLRSRPVRARLDALAGGAVMPNLSNTALAGLPIDLPPMLQQRRIVELLDALALEVHRLRRVNEQKQAALAALKRSLLHQAFNGEL